MRSLILLQRDIFTLSETEQLALVTQIAEGMKCISQLELVHGNLCAKSCYLTAKNRVQARWIIHCINHFISLRFCFVAIYCSHFYFCFNQQY